MQGSGWEGFCLGGSQVRPGAGGMCEGADGVVVVTGDRGPELKNLEAENLEAGICGVQAWAGGAQGGGAGS